jgi:hypothetical protein
MVTFLKDLNLRNSTTAQLTVRIWHNARPWKVGMLIWLIFNKGLPVGTWLQMMGLPSLCKVATPTKINVATLALARDQDKGVASVRAYK